MPRRATSSVAANWSPPTNESNGADAMSDDRPRIISRRDILRRAGMAGAAAVAAPAAVLGCRCSARNHRADAASAVAARGAAPGGLREPDRDRSRPARRDRRAPDSERRARARRARSARRALHRSRARRRAGLVASGLCGRAGGARPLRALVARQAVSRAVGHRPGLGADRRRDRCRHRFRRAAPRSSSRWC